MVMAAMPPLFLALPPIPLSLLNPRTWAYTLTPLHLTNFQTLQGKQLAGKKWETIWTLIYF